MAENSAVLTDNDFQTQFENQTLAPEHFDHQGHLRIAWLYLNQYKFKTALIKICNGIKSYAESLGAKDKFNLTVTDAIVKVIAQRIEANPTPTWQLFIEHNQDIYNNAIEVLTQYYSEKQLFSDSAKATVLTPDIKPIEI